MFSTERVIMWARRSAIAFLLAVALAGASACGSSGSGGAKHVALVAYSTPQGAYQALIRGFAATPAGRGGTISRSFGASGDQSRAVLAGQPADVVNFSLSPDMTKLVQAGDVGADWNAGPNRGFVTDSVVVIIVRKGNPKHIAGWDDLIRPGVRVITPNPLSSGSARWNIMAAYGAELKEGKTPSQSQAYLASLLHNVASQPATARDALQTFLTGEGDALIDYESEAIPALRSGRPIQYVIPRDTLLIQNPIAVLATGGHSASARDFVNYLLSPAGQRIFAAQGYRPVEPRLVDPKVFPTPPGLFTIDAVGGWKQVTGRFFDPNTGIVTKLEQGLGASPGQ